MHGWRRYQGIGVVIVLVGAVASLVISGGKGSQAGPPALQRENEQIVYRGATACGVERWFVKTGMDTDSRRVNTRSIVSTNIQRLRSLPAPSALPLRNRIRPTETTDFTVAATLLRYKLEGDSDVHLVIADSSGRTMIAEIPSPDCVGATSPFLAAIRSTRTAFDSRFRPTAFWQRPNLKVQVTGVGYFDFPHGQSGVAPNAVEIHPVLRLQIGGSSTPPPPPATVTPAGGPIHVSAGVSDTTPARYSTVTVLGRITAGSRGIAHVPMTATWHYKTSTPTCTGISDSVGRAQCSRNIYKATSGFTVRIDVSFSYGGRSYTAQTNFTPK